MLTILYALALYLVHSLYMDQILIYVRNIPTPLALA